MARVIAICNQKGGVGKSTTAVNIGAYVALSGKRTLLVDLDPQGNATISSGITRAAIRKHMADVLLRGASMEEVTQASVIDGMSIAPSGAELAGAEMTLEGDESAQTLRRALEPILPQYDAIWLDCPPSLGVLTVNALTAADGVLVPVQCEYLALEGLNSLLASIQRVKAAFNPSLEIYGILLTMTDPRTSLCHEVMNDVRKFFGDLVFQAAIPRNVRLAECPSFGKPVCAYDPHSSGAVAYAAAAQEMLAKLFAPASHPIEGAANQQVVG